MHDKLLFGRESELKRLREALVNPAAPFVAVRGASGAGKTALVQHVLADCRRAGHIVGEAKYSEENYSKGFVPIMAALSQAVSHALDLLYDPIAGANSLRDTLAHHRAILHAAGFDIPHVFSTDINAIPQPARGGAAQISEAIFHLLKWLRGFGVPIVIFIDDWQRAPQDSHSFAVVATRDDRDHLVTVLVAERTAADLSSSPVLTTNATIIDLGALDHAAAIRLLGRTLGDDTVAGAVHAWLRDVSTGLPFDLIEAARALKAKTAVRNGSIDSAAAAAIDRSDTARAVAQRVMHLSTGTRTVATAFALWGDRAPICDIADATGIHEPDVRAALSALEADGIVEVVGSDARLIHDRIRRAILDTAEPKLTHELLVRMAGRLLHPAHCGRYTRLALRMRLQAGLTDLDATRWCALFASEASASRGAADIIAADVFAEAAWSLRTAGRPHQRNLDMILLREAALAAAGRYDTQALRERIAVLIAQATDDNSMGFAYETAIIAATRAGDARLAWDWSREGLNRLGAGLPSRARKIDMYKAILQWRLSMWLPPGKPAAGRRADTVDALSRIVHFATVTAYGLDPRMALLMGLRTAARSRRLGYQSSYWCGRNILHFAALGDPATASSSAVAVQPDVALSPFARAATLYRVLYFGLIWTRPLASLRAGYAEIFDIAVAEGDLVYAALAIRNSLLIAWRTSPTLDALDAAIEEAQSKAVRLGDANALRSITIYADTSRALRDPRGFAIDHSTAPWTSLQSSPGSEAPTLLIDILSLRGEWAELCTVAAKHARGRISLSSHPGGVVWRFQENLARLKLGLAPSRADLRYIRRAAALNPTDHLGKLRILEAENLTRKRRKQQALAAYAVAVATAGEGSSPLEAGLAAESAADAAQRFGEPLLASDYRAKANAIWAAWGVNAKLKGLVETTGTETIRDQLQQATSRAELAARSERAKSKFLAEVSHELRTPLQGMQSILDIAAYDPSQFDLKQFRDVFASLKLVVDDLADLGALGGGAPLNAVPILIVDLVRSECAVVEPIASAKGLRLNISLPSDDIVILADGGRIRQVVRNLLSNAVKYTSSGEVRLRLESGHPQADGTVEIRVDIEDTGPGLSEQDLLRIFEPFDRGQRIDNEGLGLGLALSRNIAERMGGTLSACNNAKHQGATFSFIFSASVVTAADNKPFAETCSRVLLVEDVALSRIMLAQLLRRSGHDVTETATAHAACEALDRGSFDVVLLDLGLPDRDGFSVLETIGRHRLAHAMNVFVLTAATDPALDRRALQMGAKAILRKPVSADDLDRIVPPCRASTSTLPFATADLDIIFRQARTEIISRSDKLMTMTPRDSSTDLARFAHQLSGLAAQFGASRIADAADAIVVHTEQHTEQAIDWGDLRSALETFKFHSESPQRSD